MNEETDTKKQRRKSTPEQIIAAAQLRIERARNVQRKNRNHRLILAGIPFEQVGILDNWNALAEDKKRAFVTQIKNHLSKPPAPPPPA